MAYMRGEWYVYGDGECMNINSVRMPMDRFEELVAMHWARMTEDERRSAIERAAEKYNGNFGADAVSKLVGLPSTLEGIEELVEALKKENEEQ